MNDLLGSESPVRPRAKQKWSNTSVGSVKLPGRDEAIRLLHACHFTVRCYRVPGLHPFNLIPTGVLYLGQVLSRP
ncbi:hypothetical protein GJ744_010382 [Endocarpon pusillum]|uniref:Uncharacterized protein n=1 Tax=Endocarpon pusillum TaxID=364733 RepID=A0A8H7AHY6_9EURO|nr:hypothetical protein GJ744_010382 [Endocarpon pusillum]